jgi:hypothetical protein
VVGYGDTQDHACAYATVLGDHSVRPSPHDTGTEAFRRAAWYHKRDPTFADALALVRKELWAHATFHGSPADTETVRVPQAFMERLTDALCYAA